MKTNSPNRFVSDTRLESADHTDTHSQCQDLTRLGPLLGSSPPMQELFSIVRKAARHRASILLTGESGTGKELVGRTLHELSPRCDQPLITLNCGAVASELIESELFGHKKGSFTGASETTRGIFEQAHKGTLFLDEITEMPAAQQVNLLRVLESGEFRKLGSDRTNSADVRIIAATNGDFNEAMDKGAFREDLYYRLAQFPIKIPPLRERGTDIEALAKHFLARRNSEEGSDVQFDDAALDKLRSHHWPGNIRELRHTVERAYILADATITPEQLIIESRRSSSPALRIPEGMTLADIEREAILQSLELHGHRKKACAGALGISVKTLYNKLEKYRTSRVDEQRDQADHSVS
ncbi:MAG: sigma-54 dependent transcriptional regulator [Gammaproteobacteria bacterium]|nr:sigma-54-dependent Fis family transcriptional regulator [Pseudomonadales bacterium]MCP5347983.1 sigma-54-dependent Fis family transcriptional regulator [Pseudomonadales bacterium]